MIDNEMQCNVCSEFMLLLLLLFVVIILRLWLVFFVGEFVVIEVDLDCVMLNWDSSLEVDENDIGDIVFDGLVLFVCYVYVFSGVRK